MFPGRKSKIEDQSDMQKKCHLSSGIFPIAFKTFFLLSHIQVILMERKKKKLNKIQTQNYPKKDKKAAHALRDACTSLIHRLEEAEAKLSISA